MKQHRRKLQEKFEEVWERCIKVKNPNNCKKIKFEWFKAGLPKDIEGFIKRNMINTQGSNPMSKLKRKLLDILERNNWQHSKVAIVIDQSLNETDYSNNEAIATIHGFILGMLVTQVITNGEYQELLKEINQIDSNIWSTKW